MKKIKLLAPLVGSLTALTAIIPAASCTYDETKTFQVSISTGFTLTNTDPIIENNAFESDITWKDEGKAVDKSKIKITVGNKTLNRDDYSYTNSTKDKKRGHIRINDGIINADVSITLNLISIDKAPISLINVSDNTKSITIEQEGDGTATVGNDLALKVTWPQTEDYKYFSNLVTIFVGAKRVYQKSADTPYGFYLTGYRLDGVTINVPKENIVDNSEIIVLVDLEQSAYAELRLLDTYHPDYVQWPVTNPQHYYNVLRTKGDISSGYPLGFESVKAGDPIEFYVNLADWEGTGADVLEDDGDLLFTAGYWRSTYSGYQMQMDDMDMMRTGQLYLGGMPLTLESDEASGAALIVKAPEGGWSAYEDSETGEIPITGWYIFDADHSYPQILIGQVSSTPIPS